MVANSSLLDERAKKQDRATLAKTHRRSPGIRFFCYFLVLAALVTIASLFFLPQLIPMSWHLLHGEFVTYHQWKVPVPKGWWTFSADGSLMMQKTEHDVSNDSQVIISDVSIPTGADFDYQKWKQSLVQNSSEDGYQLVGERETLLTGQKGYCLTFSATRNPEKLRITCLVPGHRLSADFAGNRRSAPVFESILDHLSRK